MTVTDFVLSVCFQMSNAALVWRVSPSEAALHSEFLFLLSQILVFKFVTSYLC